jgi:hypothetical protein
MNPDLLSETPPTGPRAEESPGALLARLRRVRAFVSAVDEVHRRGEPLAPHIARVRELADLQERLDGRLAHANDLQKRITSAVVPGMFYYLLTLAILVTLSGFVIISYPEMRIYFIAGMGALFVAFLVFYLVRMQRFRRTTGALQDELGRVSEEAEKLLEAVGEREAALREQGLPLETDSYVEYRPALNAAEAGRVAEIGEALGLAALEAAAARLTGETLPPRRSA